MLSLLTGSAKGADRIILRNLKIITDKTVTSFDEDGVRLNNAQILGWDEIEKAKIASDQQAAFDAMLGELGDPLYRIRQRLSVGDYEGLLTHAEAIQEHFVGRTSDAAYLALQALMWGRLAVGKREAALTAYLQCYDILRRRGKSSIRMPGERQLAFDPQTALSADLTPIWFDTAAAKAEMPHVFQVIRGMKDRPEGVFIYYASLASAAGDDETSGKVLGAVKSTQPPVSELRDIIAAQREILTGVSPSSAVQRLQAKVDQLTAANLPLGRYWLGRFQLGSDQAEVQQQGLLNLLRIPAVYGANQPELAGAALSLAVRKLADLKDVRGSVALRGELLAKYGSTYAAKQLDAQTPSDIRP
ncbi:MAG: hypothetical protein H6822_06760 [Planctomycetaceae bacterium]|nr:hypothetical protein [Planctomycetales bacterium]MCB9921862.1 hypothetical protein [Planctomycetaceae bacterium]